ncbi:hypothetical protein ABLE93_15650 [Xanthobacter sp. KR7-65]|uniref:hypothetical protein n=1 Tax=Xanthobacter sp. KR7-65 TaxID=3156612 RepID=UPI0032B5775F
MTRRTSAGRPGRALAIVPQPPAVQFEHQPELRDLMMLPTLPPGHMTFPVEDNAVHPHLRRCEFAVVDLADHQPAQGELFLIAYRDLRIECDLSPISPPVQERVRMHWIPPADPRDCEAALRSGRFGASEGPFTTEHAAEKLVGRVVGVRVPERP